MPVLMCDKSTIEALSRPEVKALYDHFFLNVSPILALEILADLKKNSTPHSKVIGLVKKINGMNSGMSANYRFLLVGALSGQPVTMDGRYLGALFGRKLAQSASYEMRPQRKGRWFIGRAESLQKQKTF